jgi:hypothetical protein
MTQQKIMITNILQYYSDLENLKSTLIDFALEYPDLYGNNEAKAQQTLLKFVQNELVNVERSIRDLRKK